MNDFVGDMITRIRNGHQARLGAVVLHPLTPKICIKLLEILYSEGYISGFYEWYDEQNQKSHIKILLKYNSSGVPAIRSVYRVSKPGRRLYVSINSL
jgi:small subunit ribosomal protein S8